MARHVGKDEATTRHVLQRLAVLLHPAPLDDGDLDEDGHGYNPLHGQVGAGHRHQAG